LMKTSHHLRSIGKRMGICSMTKASMIGWSRWPRFSHNNSSWLWSIGFGIHLFVLLGFLYALALYTLGSPPLTKYIQTKNSRAQSESKKRRRMVSRYHFAMGRTTQIHVKSKCKFQFHTPFGHFVKILVPTSQLRFVYWANTSFQCPYLLDFMDNFIVYQLTIFFATFFFYN
jgi:hypothetical protein